MKSTKFFMLQMLIVLLGLLFPIYVDAVYDNSKTEHNNNGSQRQESSRMLAHTQDEDSIPSKEIISVGNVSFVMVKVEGGTFEMGSNDDYGESERKPVHSVTLSDYYIGETEVTQSLWEVVMGNNPSLFKEDSKIFLHNRPVENVSWEDCQRFITKLNKLTGKDFRLPTEAEWEYAARGGNKSKGYKYSGSDSISDVAWYRGNTITTNWVKLKRPNELGLYDMSGNVWEWCQDWYGSYGQSPQYNPKGPKIGKFRILRGGCYDLSQLRLETTERGGTRPAKSENIAIGLRLAQ